MVNSFVISNVSWLNYPCETTLQVQLFNLIYNLLNTNVACARKEFSIFIISRSFTSLYKPISCPFINRCIPLHF